MILDLINKENDIKKVDKEDYDRLAEEIRSFIIQNVSKTGGHLSSSLGVVELTMALHLSLNFPEDKLLWDVGHQAYAHKILTGRKNDFDSLRKLNGISGFPTLKESKCDAFGMGHASTSLSAALGYVKARELSGENYNVISVIGDGALTGGLAFEALNNISTIKSNMIIILNDNEMSISKNVGGVSKLLDMTRTSEKYNDFKENIKDKLSKIPVCGDNIIGRIHKTKSSIKQLFVPGMFFEDMGITYLGPVDGHDIKKLMRMISLARKVNHAVLIHVHTKKGKGYRYSERKPSFYHGVEPFNVDDGRLVNNKKIKTYSDIFSSEIIKLADNDKKIVAITAAMSSGTGLKKFEKKYPERFYDVGIAEEHAVTFAAGLAAAGLKPYVAIYSTFLQRAFDQILHDVCIQKLPVRFIVERAGIVGSDGITHQGIFDLSYLNIIPDMTVMAPKNGREFADMLEFSAGFEGPLAIRIPRGEVNDAFSGHCEKIEYKKSEILLRGNRIAILAAGSMVKVAGEVSELLSKKGITPTIVNARFIKPLDTDTIAELSGTHELIVTLEENVENGGFGQSVLSFVNNFTAKTKVLNIALLDEFIEHGKTDELLHIYGMDAESVCKKILKRLAD